MASESADSQSVTVTLPPELEEWLDRQAAELDVDRETVLVQLLAAHRATVELDEGTPPLFEEDLVTADAVESMVRDVLSSRLPDLATAVEDQIASDLADDLSGDVQNQLDALERDFQTKLQDVRDRVIQVKREADAKAPADHDHEQLDAAISQLDALETEVRDLQETVVSLESDLDDSLASLESRLDDADDDTDDLRAQLEDVESRLRTVAWVVRDLKDAHESDVGAETVDAIKRTAARNDVSRAVCDNCGNGVDLGLLTEPTCPHCDATVTDIDPSSGFFRKPRLLVAAQIEGGTEPDQRTARRDAVDDIASTDAQER